MGDGGKRALWADCFWLVLLGALSSVWCVTSACELSATFDEPAYLSLGLHHWRTGSAGPLLRLGTMPLPPDVQTLPIYLYERFNHVQFDPVADGPRLLPWARGANLVFWWLLLL